MKMNLQAVQFKVDQKLVDFIQKKLDKLEHFYSKIINADVYLKLENTSDAENKIVEIRLFIPGDDLVVKKKSKTFEEATDNVVHVLERHLKKRKQKQSVY